MPAALWNHPMFRGCAEYVAPATPLAVSVIESHLRRIRNMPSSADQTGPALLEGLRQMSDWSVAILPKLPRDSFVNDYLAQKTRIKRLLMTPDSDDTAALRASILRGIERCAPAHLREFIPAATASVSMSEPALRFVDALLLDNCLRNTPSIRKCYLQKAYRAADAALRYNSTTDAPRMLPVLAWARHVLREDGRIGVDYVDIGCAFNDGAPALTLAARILRENGLCHLIHGTDIVVPSLELRRRLRRDSRVGVYYTNPIRRPLPRAYDVVMLANVHRHLNRDLQERMLGNLALSLVKGGYLFVTWRFDKQNNPCVCLRRVGRSMEIKAMVNLV